MAKPDNLNESIAELRAFPGKIQNIVDILGSNGLKKSHKEGGWNGIQQIHHIADAQNMTYYRLKLIVSNDRPTLIPFDQDEWMNYRDSTTEDIRGSLNMIKGTYLRWADFMEGLSDADWEKKAVHPEQGELDVNYIFNYYFQHGKSHLRNLESLLNK